MSIFNMWNIWNSNYKEYGIRRFFIRDKYKNVLLIKIMMRGKEIIIIVVKKRRILIWKELYRNILSILIIINIIQDPIITSIEFYCI